MSADFLSRVRAEALHRIEAERFEAAVVAEIQVIRRQSRNPLIFIAIIF